jgi:hypothetical protein
MREFMVSRFQRAPWKQKDNHDCKENVSKNRLSCGKEARQRDDERDDAKKTFFWGVKRLLTVQNVRPDIPWNEQLLVDYLWWLGWRVIQAILIGEEVSAKPNFRRIYEGPSYG